MLCSQEVFVNILLTVLNCTVAVVAQPLVRAMALSLVRKAAPLVSRLVAP